MRLEPAAIIVTLAGTLAAGAPLRQAERVDRVVINAIVRDAKGSPVSGLTRGDFDVRVDGQPRQVAAMSAAAAPTVVLLLDATQSTRGILRGGSYESAIENFVTGLEPPDRVRIGVMARTLRLSEAATSDRRQLISDTRDLLALRKEERMGPSPIWDAAIGAVDALQREPGQRAVILVSDGRASGNLTSLREAAIHAIAGGVSISAVSLCDERLLMHQNRTTAAGVAPGRQFAWLADMTGGVCAPLWRTVNAEDALVLSLQAVLQAMRRAYALEIPLRADDGPNPALNVEVIRPGLTVSARRGFVSTRLP